MPTTTIYFELTAGAIAMLDEIVEQGKAKDPGLTDKKWVYLVFRKIAGDWTRTLDRLGEYGEVEINRPYPSAGTDVLKASTVKWDAFEWPTAGSFSFVMPERMAETMLRGVAFQSAWNAQEKVKAKWKTAGEWLKVVATDAIIEAHAAAVGAEIDREAEALYPPPKPARPARPNTTSTRRSGTSASDEPPAARPPPS